MSATRSIPRKLRKLALIVLALFLASYAAAAANACIAGLGAASHELPRIGSANHEAANCVSAQEAGLGNAGCDQGHRGEDPKFAKDPPSAILHAPAPAALRVRFEPLPVTVLTDAGRHGSASLTILFGNLRF